MLPQRTTLLLSLMLALASVLFSTQTKAQPSTLLDKVIQKHIGNAKGKPTLTISDSGFLRRAYVDIIGLPPTPEEFRVFIADSREDKRSRLLRKLLNSDARFAEAWYLVLAKFLQISGNPEEQALREEQFLVALQNNMSFDRVRKYYLLQDQSEEEWRHSIINTVWTKLIGYPLYTPKSRELKWQKPILKSLEAEFLRTNYDLRKLVEAIVFSQFYQNQSLNQTTAPETLLAPAQREMNPFQFADAVAHLCQYSPERHIRLFWVNDLPLAPVGVVDGIYFQSARLRGQGDTPDFDITGANLLLLTVRPTKATSKPQWVVWEEARVAKLSVETPLAPIPYRSDSADNANIQIQEVNGKKQIRIRAGSTITFILPEGVTRFRARVRQENADGDEMKVAVLIARREALNDRPSIKFRKHNFADSSWGDGTTLDTILTKGAEYWHYQGANPQDLIGRMYLAAISRKPTEEEFLRAVGNRDVEITRELTKKILKELVQHPEFRRIP